jgi:D-hydroxyproline dehydrogenase
VKTALVIGGGLIGTACAWQLQRVGFQTTLVDPGEPRGAASWGNAGHLAIEQIDPLASRANLRSLPRRLFSRGGPVGLPWRDVGAWLPFGLKLMAASEPARFERGRRALAGLLAQAMPAWQRLTQQTHTAQHLRVGGHYVVWESAQTAEQGQRQWLQADTGQARVCAATQDELAQLQARFNQRPVGALRFEGTGQILDLAAARTGVAQALTAQGGAVIRASASHIGIHQGRATATLNNGQQLMADVVVVATGAHTAPLLRPSEGTVPLIAERGYHLQSVSAAGPQALPPVAFEDRSVIVTQFAATLRIAGFTEFSQLASAPDGRKWQALANHARALGLPLQADSDPWVGARPTLPDYLPAIGHSRAAFNLLYAFGHQHLGVTLAAVTGELVAALAQGMPPAVDLTPFDLKRFQ